MNSPTLRRLLEGWGSYPAIETMAASGELHELLPVRLFEHIGIVYRRLEVMTVGDVLSYLASGMTEDAILADFPQLTRDDIRACLAFAAERERRLMGIPAA